jgi:ABC-type sugar transport system ATPase subunit
MVEMTDLQSKAKDLSGGQQQRVAWQSFGIRT